MDIEQSVAFEDKTFNLIKVHFAENISPSEAAKEIIKNATEPYVELERSKLIKGLRIVLYGGAVDKLKPPKDYDILVLYDKFEKSGEQVKSLSEKAQKIVKKVFSKDDAPRQNVAYKHDYYSDNSIPHAEYAEIFLTSNNTFLTHLNESDENKRKRAFQQLIGLPHSVYAKYVPPGEILNSEPDIDWSVVENSVLFCLIMAKGFNHTFEDFEIDILSKVSHELSSLLRGTTGLNTRDKLVKKYVEERVDKILSKEQIERMQRGLKEGDGENVIVMKELIVDYTKTSKLNEPEKERVLWLFESLRRKMNLEEMIASSGHLIYGENVANKGKDIFKEDPDFIKFPK